MGLAADIGTLQRFPKITGNDSKARELALTGRKFGPQEAKEIGFISDVVQGGRKDVVGKYEPYHSLQHRVCRHLTLIVSHSTSSGNSKGDCREEPNSSDEHQTPDES